MEDRNKFLDYTQAGNPPVGFTFGAQTTSKDLNVDLRNEIRSPRREGEYLESYRDLSAPAPYSSGHNNLATRLGFACRLNDKTSIGAGCVFNSPSCVPRALDNGATLYATLANSYAGCLTLPRGRSLGDRTFDCGAVCPRIVYDVH